MSRALPALAAAALVTGLWLRAAIVEADHDTRVAEVDAALADLGDQLVVLDLDHADRLAVIEQLAEESGGRCRWWMEHSPEARGKILDRVAVRCRRTPGCEVEWALAAGGAP